MLPPRTLHLIERTPQIARISSEDLAFLLERHRNHLEILPTGRAGRYQLRPRGVVGVIQAPDCRLVVAPKIPLRNLFFLLNPEQPLPAASDHTDARPADSVLDFLAGQLAFLMEQRERAGLYRDYREQAEQGSHLLGRLDVVEQMRQGPVHKDRIHSRSDDRVLDLPCNQIPRSLAELLLAGSELDPAVATSLRQALPGWEGVPARSFTGGEVRQVVEASAPADYRPILELCLLLTEGLAPGMSAGTTPSPTFLLDMERVFEQYLTRGLVRALDRPGWRTEVQRARIVSEARPGQADVSMKPDLLVTHQGRPMLVVDAKWKRLRQGLPETADLYQMLAYCTALGVDRAALVYPGRRNRLWTYRIGEVGVEVGVHTLCVTAAPRRCRGSLRRLGRALRRSLAD
jgi:5-methylcytosine-specific restriction enzyme subunit McrC